MLLRAQQCILGQMIGDSLGARYEFCDKYYHCSPKDMIKKDINSNGFLPMLGEGFFGIDKGQITDDSEMALSLMYSIIDCGKIDSELINKAYINWANSNPFDIGNNTNYIFKNKQNTNSLNAQYLAKQYDIMTKKKYGTNNLSNGCIMRISPIGITLSKILILKKDYESEKIESFIINTIANDTLLSHSSEEAHIGAATFVALIAGNIAWGKKNFTKTINLVKNIAIKNSTIYKIFTRAINHEPLNPSPIENIGYLGTGLQLAILRSIQVATSNLSFHRAIVSTIELGGDTDTNAAIVGAAIGPLSDDIPIEWINNIINDENKKNIKLRKHFLKPYARFQIPDVAKLLNIYN